MTAKTQSKDTDVVSALAAAIVIRDYDAVTTTLDPGISVRALLPLRVDDWVGIEPTMDHFQDWYERIPVAWTRVDPVVEVADRYFTGWRFEGNHRDGTGWHVVEQRALCWVTDGLITRIDLVCSGFRKTPAAVPAGDRQGEVSA